MVLCVPHVDHYLSFVLLYLVMQSTCCGKYEFLQKRDPRAAVLFGDAEAFEEQDHLRLKNTITTVISIPANPASLEETLRLLGRRNFAHAVSEIVVASVYLFVFCNERTFFKPQINK